MGNFTFDTQVDLVAVLALALSLALAVHQFLSARIKVTASSFVLIDAPEKAKDSFFLHGTIINRSANCFSLVSCYVFDKPRGLMIPIEPTVRTFSAEAKEDKAAVRPVVLSSRFPVRFEPYDAHTFLLEVDRRHIDIPSMRQGCPDRNPEELRGIQRFLCRLCTHRPPLRLVMNSSKGRRAVPIYVTSVEPWNYLQDFAVRKAAHEEKIEFPC